MLFINGMLAVSIVLLRCHKTPAGTPRWVIRFDEGWPDWQPFRWGRLPPRLRGSHNAEAVGRLLGGRFGKRPFRITIDPLQAGSEFVAAVQDRFRRDTLFRVGLADLLHPAPTGRR